MAQTILLKRRTSDATAPSPSDLTTGEVAVNAYSGKLYIKKTDGTVAEVSGSGGGGSSFPSVFTAYKYTATNGQTTFSGNDANSVLLTYNVGNLQVFLNGVLLVPTTDFVASTGNTVVLQDGATTNDILTVVAYSATISDGNIAVDSFSGDGTTTAFTLASNPQNENNTSVFIDGIYQSKANYAISGTTLTFSEAPPNNTAIEVNTGTREVTQYSASTLELPNAGINVTGGNVDLASDSIKLRLGASNDLQLFHDGTNNYIQGGTGDLRIDAKSGERGIVVTPDGATTLYHDNAAKIATASGGVTITGTATATTFVGALTGNVTGNVSGTSGSTTGNSATATALATARTIGGTSFDGTANIAVNLAATATALATARTIGGTSFDGTANIVPATAVAVTGAAQTAITSVGTLSALAVTGTSTLTGNVGIGTSSTYNMRATIAGAGSALTTGTGSYAVASIYDTATPAAGTGGGLAFQGDDGTNSAVTFATVNGSKENATSGNYASYLGFSTRANSGSLTEKVRIDSTGNVSIGTALSPQTFNVLGTHENAGFYRDYSGTGVAATYLNIGRKDTNGALIAGLRIAGGGDDGVVASHNGFFEIAIRKAGAFVSLLSSYSGGSELVVNENSVDMDFRVESDANTHALFVEGSTGNVGIGTSGVASTRLAVTNSVVGVNIETTSSNAGHEALIVNRQNSDGTAIAINKAGATKGSLGTTTSAGGTRFAIGAVGDPGIIFAGTGVFPATQITASDNSVDLGSGNYRWKDLYLSGGVNFSDATGGQTFSAGNAANTLSDYEVGTFTATLKGGTSGTITAGYTEYTKIGNTVHCRVAFLNVNTTGYSGHLRVEGLPFPMANSQLRNVCTPAIYLMGAFTADYVVGLLESSTHVNFYAVRSANTWNSVAHNAGSSRYLEFNVTYNTNA